MKFIGNMRLCLKKHISRNVLKEKTLRTSIEQYQMINKTHSIVLKIAIQILIP